MDIHVLVHTIRRQTRDIHEPTWTYMALRLAPAHSNPIGIRLYLDIANASPQLFLLLLPLQVIMQPSLVAASRASCRDFLVHDLLFGQPAALSLAQPHHLTEQSDRPLCVGPP
ncbi:hypothetical protein PMIN06_000624 [Paraphaeosphaeria minitans]